MTHSSDIRRHYQRLRRSLPPQTQLKNEIALAENLRQYLGHIKQRKIASYLAHRGEISLASWMSSGCERNQVYLPMLYEPIEPRLRFAPLTNKTQWKRNRFGITEPDLKWKHTLHARQLDIVLLPLVAFDRNGHRLGMGGGYYDRTLGFRGSRQHWLKPLLIGVAHSIQEHAGLQRNPWDIPLDAVITEAEIIPISPQAHNQHYLRNNS